MSELMKGSSEPRCEQAHAFIDKVWGDSDRERRFIDLDVLLFFLQNPAAIESPHNVAMRIGRSLDQVQESVKRLVGVEVLELRGALWGEPFVALTSEPEMLGLLDRFNARFLTTRRNIIELFGRLNDRATTRVRQ